MAEFKMEIVDNIDYTIEEKNNSYLVIRNVSWNGRTPRLEIRNCSINKEGEEQLGKGCHFLNETGPTELIKTMIRYDLCDITEVIKEIKKKENGLEMIGTCLKEEEKQQLLLFHYIDDNEEEIDDTEYFDISTIL